MGNNTRPNPDDRRDNVERIEYNIGKTIQNMKRAEDMIQITDDEKTKQDLIEKNERRRDALKGMREEIREEAIARKNNYQ
ncbi:MAG: small acid-soluble spore protein Tlp [Anaerovoracaceae bacterium]|jgi:small acid-soluble spore protein (thioredoxin-like protein)